MSKIEFVLADTTEQAMLAGLDLLMQKAEQDKFGSYIALIPEQKTIMAEKYLLKRSSNGAFANIYIYSPNRLLFKISPTASSNVLSKVGSIMVVRKIIFDNIDKLVCYRKSAKTNGFAEVIFGTISQLKSSGVGVSEFYDMIDSASASLKIKLQDIALIYDQYQQYIENNYIDQLDVVNVLSAVSENSQFIKDSNIYFLGHESTTSQILNMCKNLAKNSKNFVVSAPYLQNLANDHIFDNEVYTKFAKLADELNYPYFPKKINKKYLPDFEHIKNNLFAYPPKIKDNVASVEILSSITQKEEIDFVAQKITKLVRNGAKYNSIAVVVPNLADYSETIEKVFNEYEFSYFCNIPYDYARHPLFNLIKSVIDILRKNYDKADVIEFLSNVFVGQSKNLTDLINYIEKYGINHNKFKEQFEKFDDKIWSQEQFDQIEQTRKFLIDTISAVEFDKQTVSEYNKCLLQMLDKLDIDEKIELLINEQQDDLVEQNVTKQARNKLYQAIEQLQMFMGAENVSLEEYQKILLSGLEVSDVSVIPVAKDCIIVSDSIDGLEGIDYLFVMNATEGNFPTKKQDCGIILDSEIFELNEKTQTNIEPTIKTINRRERFKAYETMIFANKQITLSYCEGFGEQSNRPCNIIDQLLTMFGGNNKLEIQKYLGEFNFDANNFEDDIKNKLCSQNKVEKYLCQEIGNVLTTDNFEASQVANGAYFAVFDKMSDNLKNKISKINLPQTYQIDTAKDIFFKDGKTSTSQLERYFTCPFLFFVDYGLRLCENQTSKLQVYDVGNILHKVAEEFVKKICKNEQIDIKNTVKNIVDDIILNNYVADDNKFLIKMVYDEAARLCERLFEEYKNSRFHPIGLEQFFGANGKYPAIRITDKISMQGKIDRIDAFNKRFRIIDYKTGKIEDNLKMVYYGKKIQLVTYLLAMQNTGFKPAAVVYYPIRNEYSRDASNKPKMKGFYLHNVDVAKDMDTRLSAENLASSILDIKFKKPIKDGELLFCNEKNYFSDKQFEDLQVYVKELCKKAVEEILDGNIVPSPIRFAEKENAYCASCKFRGVCGVEKTNFADGRKCYSKIEIEDISNIGGKINERN